jgi:hypothetical protein
MRLVDATVRKRAALECRYVVVGGDGRIALADVSLPGQDLTFAIELDGRLPAGRYHRHGRDPRQRQRDEFRASAHPAGDRQRAVKPACLEFGCWTLSRLICVN